MMDKMTPEGFRAAKDEHYAKVAAAEEAIRNRPGLLKAAAMAEREAERQRKGVRRVSYALGLQEFAARLRAAAKGE